MIVLFLRIRKQSVTNLEGQQKEQKKYRDCECVVQTSLIGKRERCREGKIQKDTDFQGSDLGFRILFPSLYILIKESVQYFK